MHVIRAEAMGMCFGVRDALTDAFARDDATEVTIHGELVHNASVNERLRAQGYETTAEDARAPLPSRPRVLITAHGVSHSERARLERAGKTLIDTTCPLVRRAHDAALRLAREGRHVIVIGKPGHVEVQGLTGDLTSFDVVPDVASVARYPHPRLGVVSQTTCQESHAHAIVEAIHAKNPAADVRFVDTVCEPTRQRVRAADDLATRADAVVVIGGKNSNNTRQLVRRVLEHGVKAFHVQGPDDLDPAWFEGCEVVGLTAGTSTLDPMIDAVQAALERIPVTRRSVPARS